jgi:hypothetical protein
MSFMHAFAKSRAAPALREAQLARAYRRTPAVRHILRAPQVQAKLKIGAVNDPAEREADRVADQVMRTPDAALAATADAPAGTVQRACAECESEVQRKADDATLQRDTGDDDIKEQLVQAYLRTAGTVQRKAESPEDDEMIRTKPAAEAEPGAALESRVGALNGGSPLPGFVRRYMEPRFGHDFADVRVHADANAAETARLANARAFTIGRNLVFGAGEYAPRSDKGRSLIAHELTHVVQQNSTGPSLQRTIEIDGQPLTLTPGILKTVSDLSPAMKEFIEKMHNSGNPPVYSFKNNDQFMDEIFIRAKAIKGMERVHEGCCGYYSNTDPPYLDKTYWDHVGTGVYFTMKSPLPAGKQPSDAIDAIFASGAKTRLECLSMMIAVEYYALLNGLKADKFNKMFAGGITISDASLPAQSLVSGFINRFEIKTVGSKSDLLAGDWVYFKNFKDYTTRVPGGLWQGENTIYIGNSKFHGFGVTPKTESEMNKELVTRYNDDGTPKLSKTEADLLADGGGMHLNTVIRPVMSHMHP